MAGELISQQTHNKGRPARLFHVKFDRAEACAHTGPVLHNEYLVKKQRKKANPKWVSRRECERTRNTKFPSTPPKGDAKKSKFATQPWVFPGARGMALEASARVAMLLAAGLSGKAQALSWAV